MDKTFKQIFHLHFTSLKAVWQLKSQSILLMVFIDYAVKLSEDLAVVINEQRKHHFCVTFH